MSGYTPPKPSPYCRPPKGFCHDCEAAKEKIKELEGILRAINKCYLNNNMVLDYYLDRKEN